MTDDLQRELSATRPTGDLDLERLREQLAQRANAEGLLDVAYDTVDSPMGPLAAFVTPIGLVRLAYEDEPVGAAVDEVARRVSPRVLRAPWRTDEVRRQLDRYFEGRATAFSVPIDWSLAGPFAARVLAALREVPYGRVTTYRDIAAAAGSPLGARAAGNALGSNPIPIVVPCHRVVHSSGGLGGYTGGLDRKRFLLRLEGALPNE